MYKTMLMLTAIVVIHECGILINRYQLDNHPQCIWVWYPKYPLYPPRKPLTTTVPSQATTIRAVTATADDGDGVSEETTPMEAATTLSDEGDGTANDALVETE